MKYYSGPWCFYLAPTTDLTHARKYINKVNVAKDRWVMESTESIFGDFGLHNDIKVKNRIGIEESYLIADHIRAYLDILYSKRFDLLKDWQSKSGTLAVPPVIFEMIRAFELHKDKEILTFLESEYGSLYGSYSRYYFKEGINMLNKLIADAMQKSTIVKGTLEFEDNERVRVLVQPVGDLSLIPSDNIDENNRGAFAFVIEDSSACAAILVVDSDVETSSVYTKLLETYGGDTFIKPLRNDSKWGLTSFNYNANGSLLPACWLQGTDPGTNILGRDCSEEEAIRIFEAIGDTTVEAAGSRRQLFCGLGDGVWVGYDRCHTAYNGALSREETFAPLWGNFSSEDIEDPMPPVEEVEEITKTEETDNYVDRGRIKGLNKILESVGKAPVLLK